MAEHRQCFTCGFLARRDRTPESPVSGFHEVPPEYRRDNPIRPPTITIVSGNTKSYQADLVCFMYAPVFPESALQHEGIRQDPAQARGALLENRDCRDWCDYRPGHSPKEHLMERRVESLEADRKALQLALDKGNRRLIIASIIIGALIGLGQIITGLLSWWLPPRPQDAAKPPLPSIDE
jgi:hypothetical protein